MSFHMGSNGCAERRARRRVGLALYRSRARSGEGSGRWPLKTQLVTIWIEHIQLLHAVWRDLRGPHFNTHRPQILIGAIRIWAREVQASVAMRQSADGVGSAGTIVRLI